MKTWVKWVAPAFAVLAVIFIIIYLSHSSVTRAGTVSSITEWIALISAILSAIAGVLVNWKKPEGGGSEPTRKV